MSNNRNQRGKTQTSGGIRTTRIGNTMKTISNSDLANIAGGISVHNHNILSDFRAKTVKVYGPNQQYTPYQPIKFGGK